MSSYGIRALVASLSAFSSVFMAGLAAMAAARVVIYQQSAGISRFQVRGW